MSSTNEVAETKQAREFWREPQHTSAAVRENNMVGAGLGMIVAAAFVLWLPWHYGPSQPVTWWLAAIAAAVSAGAGAWNIVRFTVETRYTIRWATELRALYATALDQIADLEDEVGTLDDRNDTLARRNRDLERENAALDYKLRTLMLSSKHTVLVEDTVGADLRRDVHSFVEVWAATGRYPSRERMMNDPDRRWTKTRWQAAYDELVRAQVLRRDERPPAIAPSLAWMTHRLAVAWGLPPSPDDDGPDGNSTSSSGQSDGLDGLEQGG